MKQSDFKKCHICEEGMMHNNHPFFYKITVEQYVIDIAAVKRQAGLEMSMGEAAPLASVMGPNEDLAKGLNKTEILVCGDHLEIVVPLLETE